VVAREVEGWVEGVELLPGGGEASGARGDGCIEVVGRSGRWYAEVAAAAAAAAGQQRRGRFGGARAKSCAVGAAVRHQLGQTGGAAM
jgi:hypothetical protein